MGPITILLAAIVALFTVIYLSFTLVSYKLSSQGAIIKTSAVALTLALGLATVLAVLERFSGVDIPSIVSTVIFAVIQYKLGQKMLKLSSKRSILAALLALVLLLVLVACITAFLYISGALD